MRIPKLRYVVPVLLALLGIVVWSIYRQPSASANNSTALHLQPPSFAQDSVVSEQAVGATDIGQKLDAEAGISAYFKSPDEINLEQVKSLFRTIELTHTDYIIGSVPVPNYAQEIFDTHVYVHKSGWILAYYPRADPLSKIIDMGARTIETTKLKSVVAAVASTVGAPNLNVTYYDFRYPNATNMILVAEDNANGNSFHAQLPSSFGYFERGWAARTDRPHTPYFHLNGTALTPIINIDYMFYGTISASQLLPDVEHQIVVNDYGVLVLIYRIP